MPHKLVEMLIKKSEGMIKKLATEASGGKPQVIGVFEFIKNIMVNNNLVPIWSELPEIKGVLRTENNSPNVKEKDELKLFEKQGKIKVKLRQNKFFLEADIIIPEQYPFKQPEVKFVDHNYDPNFARIFFA